jgi:membrane-associated phospholipid phosphatase
MTLSSLYKQNKIFFLGYFLLLIVAAFFWIFFSKANGFILLNPYHSKFLNVFFITTTIMGDGIFSVVIAILLFLFKKRFLALMVFSSFAISGILTQLIKMFISEARPALFLAKDNYPYFIENVTLHNFHSFPSGHSTSAFALASILCFAVKNKKWSVVFLLAAALVGYSRIYLGQHFITDVAVGSIIAVLISIFCWICFHKYFMRISAPQKEKDQVKS